jgi:hypothetical protein
MNKEIINPQHKSKSDAFSQMTSNVKKFREVWKTQDVVSFYLSALEYRHAVLGWCSYIIRPNVEPFSKLKHSDKFKIIGENSEYYICRVDDIKVYEDVSEAVNESNYRSVFPDGSLMSIDRVRFMVSIQVYNNRYKQHIKKYGLPPKVAVIKFSLYNDPKE